MKDLNYYMSLPYHLEIIPDKAEGGYAARFPELPGCLTCADTMTELIPMAEDAKKTWLESALADGIKIPEPKPLDREYSGQFKLRLPKSLHRLLADHAKSEGLSMNQYCLYLLARNDVLQSEGAKA